MNHTIQTRLKPILEKVHIQMPAIPKDKIMPSIKNTPVNSYH